MLFAGFASSERCIRRMSQFHTLDHQILKYEKIWIFLLQRVEGNDEAKEVKDMIIIFPTILVPTVMLLFLLG